MILGNYCKDCGHRIRINEPFCPNCGCKTGYSKKDDLLVFSPPVHDIGFLISALIFHRISKALEKIFNMKFALADI